MMIDENSFPPTILVDTTHFELSALIDLNKRDECLHIPRLERYRSLNNSSSIRLTRYHEVNYLSKQRRGMTENIQILYLKIIYVLGSYQGIERGNQRKCLFRGIGSLLQGLSSLHQDIERGTQRKGLLKGIVILLQDLYSFHQVIDRDRLTKRGLGSLLQSTGSFHQALDM